MSLKKEATKGHFIAGVVLALLSLVCLVVKLIFKIELIEIGIFFFGVWGGVEIGRYLEYLITKK